MIDQIRKIEKWLLILKIKWAIVFQMNPKGSDNWQAMTWSPDNKWVCPKTWPDLVFYKAGSATFQESTKPNSSPMQSSLALTPSQASSRQIMTLKTMNKNTCATSRPSMLVKSMISSPTGTENYILTMGIFSKGSSRTDDAKAREGG